MNIRVEVDLSKLNMGELGANIQNDTAFWTFAATEWHRLYSPYVPIQQGNLRDTVSIRPKEIEHTVPYAHYQYEGIVYGPNYPIFENGKISGFYSKGPKSPTGESLKYKNSKASAKWDQAAIPTQMPKLLASLQGYIDQKGLK